MAMTNEQKNMAGGALMLVAGLWAFFYYIIAPQNRSIDQKRTTIEETVSKIHDLKRKAQKMEALERENQMLTLELAASEKQLPSKDDIANLLRYVTETAQATGVEIVSFQPNTPSSREYFTELAFNIDMKAGYHSLAQFLNTVNQAERIIAARSLRVGVWGGADKGSPQTISANFSIVTYMLQ